MTVEEGPLFFFFHFKFWTNPSFIRMCTSLSWDCSIL